MGDKMKFGVLIADKRAEVHQKDIPFIKADEVLVNNKACNICTTDYQQWLGDRHHQPYPMAFGHENSGVVVQVGSEVKNCKIGDHVVINIYGPCLECSNCRKGENSIYCENSLASKASKSPDENGMYGFYGCGEYQVAKSKHIFKIKEDLPFEEAGFVEPLATVVYGIHRLRIKVGEKVLVIGAGTMGLLNAQVARYYGADVIISELFEKKLKTAKTLGFSKIINPNKDNVEEKIKEFLDEGEKIDAIVIAVGATSAYNQAIKIAPKGCRFLIFAAGYPAPVWTLEPNMVHYNLWEIIGTYGCSTKDYEEAAALLSKRNINTEPLIEEKYHLKDIQKAFEKAATPGTYRTAIIISEK